MSSNKDTVEPKINKNKENEDDPQAMEDGESTRKQKGQDIKTKQPCDYVCKGSPRLG